MLGRGLRANVLRLLLPCFICSVLYELRSQHWFDLRPGHPVLGDDGDRERKGGTQNRCHPGLLNVKRPVFGLNDFRAPKPRLPPRSIGLEPFAGADAAQATDTGVSV